MLHHPVADRERERESQRERERERERPSSGTRICKIIFDLNGVSRYITGDAAQEFGSGERARERHSRFRGSL
jgi:hypothetical protein